MNKKALSLAICMAMAIPTVSSALSLGEIQSNSSLNQPFRGQINLLSTSVAEAKNLQVRVASPAIFNRVGIDRPAFLNSIRFRTTVQNGKPVILVSSSQPIHEPFLNFLLEVNWPNGQLLKEYTVLLDPPVLLRPDTAIASNRAGVRAEPRAQGRVTRPAAQRQQPRRAQQPRQRVVRAAPQRAPARRAAPQRRVVAQQQRRVARVAPQSRSYRVRSGDTLGKIARRMGYRGVRSEQMMVALFEKNRRAFTRSNMNNLKAGALINRPSLQEARSLSIRKAKSQIIAQARDWKKARATALAKKGSNNGIKVAANQNNQARLEVVGNRGAVNPDAKSATGVGGMQAAEVRKQLALTNESLTTKKKENEELKSRVSELESLLRKKNRLITLKSEQLAQLQASMGVKPSADANANNEPVVTMPDQTAVVNEGVDIQQQVANDLANQNGEIIRNNDDQSAMFTGATNDQAPVDNNMAMVTPDSEPAEDNTSAFVDDGVEEQSSMDIMGLLGSPMAMGIGGGSLLALLGGLWFMRRRRNNNEYEEFDYTSDIDNDELDASTPEFNDVTIAETQPSSMIDESEFVEHDEMRQEHIKNSGLLEGDQEDLLQEADVYIVYGLHDQAEAELKEAISNDPNNLAYRAKLLENYKAAGNKDAFEDEAKAFMQLEVEGKDKYLAELSEWGKELIPESKLFSTDALKGAAAAATAGVAMVAGTAVAKGDDTIDEVASNVSDSFDNNFDNDLEDLDLDDVLSDDISSDSNLIEDIDIDIDALDKDDFSIDDLTDIDEDFTQQAAGTSFEEIDAIGEESVDQLLDSADADALDLSGFDLDDEPGLDTNIAADDKFDIALDSDSNMDVTNLNLDLDSDKFEKIMPNDSQYKSTASSDDDLLADLDDSLSVDGIGDHKVEDNLLAEFDDNLSFLDLDDNDSDGIEETQIDTKLDLAKAYIDMGDIEGARSTLEEVMQEGSDDQKREAEELLHQTG